MLCQSDKGCYYSTSEAINLFIIRYTIRGIHILDLGNAHLLILLFVALSSKFNLEKHRNKHIRYNKLSTHLTPNEHHRNQ